MAKPYQLLLVEPTSEAFKSALEIVKTHTGEAYPLLFSDDKVKAATHVVLATGAGRSARLYGIGVLTEIEAGGVSSPSISTIWSDYIAVVLRIERAILLRLIEIARESWKQDPSYDELVQLLADLKQYEHGKGKDERQAWYCIGTAVGRLTSQVLNYNLLKLASSNQFKSTLVVVSGAPVAAIPAAKLHELRVLLESLIGNATPLLGEVQRLLEEAQQG